MKFDYSLKEKNGCYHTNIILDNLVIFLSSNFECKMHSFSDVYVVKHNRRPSFDANTNECGCRETGIAIDNVGSDIKLSTGSIAHSFAPANLIMTRVRFRHREYSDRNFAIASHLCDGLILIPSA